MRPNLICSCFVMLLGTLNLSDLKAEEINFETVLAHALKESPAVKAIDAKLADSIGDAIKTKTLSNPVLNAEFRYPESYSGNRPDTEVEASLEQPFRLSNLGLRQSVSRLIEMASGINQKINILEFTQNVKLAYVKLWALEAKQSQVTQARKRAGVVAKLIDDSSKQGLLSQSEAKLFQAQEKKLSADLIGLEADIKRAKAELIRISNFDISKDKLKKPEISILNDEAYLFEKIKTGSIPGQQKFELLRKVASEQRRLAERDSFPELAPRFVYQHTSDGINQFGAGIRIDLPFFDRNQGERARTAGAESSALAEERYYKSEAFQSEIKLRLDAVKSFKQQAQAYEKEVVPALLESVKGSEELLKAGQSSASAVFQTQRELLDVSSRALELWTKAISEQSELVILVGDEF